MHVFVDSIESKAKKRKKTGIKQLLPILIIDFEFDWLRYGFIEFDV